MPPPPLFTHTTCRSAPARAAASRPPTSCTSATSPISTHVGAPVASAAPAAEATTPSMPLAPRLARKRIGTSTAGKNASTSRTGIDELTHTCAPSGSSLASAA